MRFNFDADTHEEAEEYLKNRFLQLRQFNVKHVVNVRVPGAVVAYSKWKAWTFKSIYVLASHRGQGLFRKYFERTPGEFDEAKPMSILTAEECNIVPFLTAQNIPHKSFKINWCPEYAEIEKHYGDGKAERSQVYLMNHIDEGVGILSSIWSNHKAYKAFMVHPIFQNNTLTLEECLEQYPHLDPEALKYAVDYRNVANAYLSKREISSLEEIEVSQYREVNEMLWADKIQNQKDFRRYHQATHPRSAELEQYFKNWIARLIPVLWPHAETEFTARYLK